MPRAHQREGDKSTRTHAITWLLRLIAVAVLALLPAATAWSQETQAPAPQQPERQVRREKRTQARERLRALRQQVKVDRQAYRETMQQHGKNSPEARAAPKTAFATCSGELGRPGDTNAFPLHGNPVGLASISSRPIHYWPTSQLLNVGRGAR